MITGMCLMPTTRRPTNMQTWFFAHLALFHQQQQAVNVTARQGEYREDRRFAEHGFAFLQTRLWDARGGGFWWLVASDGTPRSAGPEVCLWVLCSHV